MIRQQYLIGRPLTKRFVKYATTDLPEDDEGYGTSPNIASPSVKENIFTFVEPSVVPIPIVNKVVEDEWSSLEKDLNQVLNIQPPSSINCGINVSKSAGNPNLFKASAKHNKDAGSFKQSRTVTCQFCAKNGEIRSVVESHTLRHPVTRAVICPVLRRYVCDLCGATGDNAHTKFYCPENNCRKTAPMAILLKTTRNNATGKRTH